MTRSPRSSHVPIIRLRHIRAGSTIQLDGRQLYLGAWDGDRALIWTSADDYQSCGDWTINICGSVPLAAIRKQP